MKTIQKKTLHEEIANNLREMIMSAELREGDKIKERDLEKAEMLMTSHLKKQCEALEQLAK